MGVEVKSQSTMDTTDISQRTFSGTDLIPLAVICTTFLLFSYLFSFIDILAADRLDAVVESYYGPPIYDMSATDVTRKWLREAFREEIENYMKQEPGDTERQEDVSYDLTDYLYHLATDSTSQRTNYGGDWSDED